MVTVPGARWELKAGMFIVGLPAGQPRVKFDTRGKYPRTYTPTEGAPQAWKELLIIQAKKFAPAEPVTGPVRVTITAFFPRTRELEKPGYPDHPIEYIQKPDDDNIRKMVLDVFTSLGYYADDKQVCGGPTEKYYCGKGAYVGPGIRPGAFITIEVNPAWPYKQTIQRKKSK